MILGRIFSFIVIASDFVFIFCSFGYEVRSQHYINISIVLATLWEKFFNFLFLANVRVQKFNYLCNVTSLRIKELSPLRASFFFAYYFEAPATDAGYLTIIPLVGVGYEMVGNQQGAQRRVGYNHLISNKREWNNFVFKNAHYSPRLYL